MKFILERVTNPEIEPVDLAAMKRHLRCFESVTDEDDDIEGLITGGREWVEDYTGRALIDQTWRLTVEQEPFEGNLIRRAGYYCGAFHWTRISEIMLRKAPILSVDSFVTVDAAGVETDVDASSYEVREADSKWPRIVGLNGATWGSGTLKITFRAGFADRLGSPQQDGSFVPAAFKQAIKLWAEANYDRDQVMMEKLLTAAENLVRRERSDLSLA